MMTTRLKKVLEEKKITQKKLAEMTDIGEYKISLLCSGKAKNVFLTTAIRICDALGVTMDEAFGDIKAM